MCCRRHCCCCGCPWNWNGNGSGIGNGNGSGTGNGLQPACGWEFVCRHATPFTRTAMDEAISSLGNFRLFEEESGCGCG